MKHVAITLLAPVIEGRGGALQKAIEALPDGPESPLARVPGLHVGRFVFVKHLEDPRNPGPALSGPGPYLMFTADVDGPPDAAVASIGTHCGDIFRYCVGCPEQRDARAFDRWFDAHRVRDGWTIMPYAKRTLAEVQDGIDARERLGRFAVEAQKLAPAALRARFLEEFGP